MPKKIPKNWKIATDRHPHDLVLTRYSPKGKPELELIFEWKRFGNRSEVVSVLIQTPEFKKPLTAADMRAIPFSLLEVVERQAKADFRTNQVVVEAKSGPQSGRALSNNDLKTIANLYREAREIGVPIAHYISKQLDISESTVGKRIAAARRADLLGAAMGTKAGERRESTKNGKWK